MKKGFIFLALIFFSFESFCFAGESVVGKIVKYEGGVTVYRNDEVKGEKVKGTDFQVNAGDVLKTRMKSSAFVKLVDNSSVFLDEQSVLTFNDEKHLFADNGTLFFKIQSQKGTKGVVVSTRTATIGVKGTKFAIVSDNVSVKCYLTEGSLSIEAVKDEFRRYVESQKDEFEDFVKQRFYDYSDYKERLKKEYVEYVKSFEMNEGKAINISDNNEVRNIEIPDYITQKFRELDDIK